MIDLFPFHNVNVRIEMLVIIRLVCIPNMPSCYMYSPRITAITSITALQLKIPNPYFRNNTIA